MEVSWKQAANNCSWQARKFQQGRSWKKLLIDNITCDEKLCESSVLGAVFEQCARRRWWKNWKVCLLCCCCYWMLLLVCQFLILLHYRKQQEREVLILLLMFLRGLWRTISDSLLCPDVVTSFLPYWLAAFNLSFFCWAKRIDYLLHEKFQVVT